MDAGILPVRQPRDAKKRLASSFSPMERQQIAEALVHDALALCRSAEFLEWWVVSDSPEVRGTASGMGFKVVEDSGEGLNAALARALIEVQAAGAESVTIVPADVPTAWRGDLEDLFDTGATADIVVVPAGSDGGTNGLYISPPDLIEPRFGTGSLQAHIKEADLKGLRCAVLALPRLGLDLDTEADVMT
ncbi:MAG: 2-phospho-L-lactate guanylyltransferase, partial [Actinobacteria bacterium]|nr:2-phospho-L-lactate guanylyltransferase [Actinomycetota bacterium]